MTDTPEATDTLPADTTAAPEVKETIPAAIAPVDPKPAEPVTEPAKAEVKAEPKAEKTKPEQNKPAKKPATVAETTEEDDVPASAPADWPDDWREKLAGEDSKLLATLKRFTSPKTFSDSYFALKQKLSSGEFQKALPENATEEQLTEWRKENGIPAKPEEYDTALPGGLVIGENDKPLVNEFLTEMHQANARPEVVKAALGAYYKILENQQAALVDLNESKKSQTEDALRAEYGNDYRRNVNLMTGLLDTFGGDAKEALLNARDSDGTMLLNNQSVIKALVGAAREINPVSTVVPGAGANAAGAITDEIAGYEKRMREDRVGWFKDAKAQSRYQELLSARERLKTRIA